MAVRKPLVIIGGATQEIPSGDTLSPDGAKAPVETDVGNGSATSIDVTHNFGLSSPYICNVVVCLNSTKAWVLPDIVFKDANTVTLTFGTAPSSNQYHVMVSR